MMRAVAVAAAAVAVVAVAVMSPLQADAGASNVCVSSGDTHMYPFGGQSRYDIYSPRPFVLTELNSNDVNRRFKVHATQRYGIWGHRTVDNDLAVQCGRDLVVFLQPRNGNVPTIKINGKQHHIGSGGRFYFPSAPGNARSRYYVSASHSHWWHTFEIHCNLRGYEQNYAFGSKVAVQWYRPYQHWWYRRIGAHRVVYANVQIETQSRYAWRFDRGACGWNRGGRQPNSVNWVIEHRDSLFSRTPADHAREAKENGMKVSDPAKLRRAAASCAAAIKRGTGLTVAKAVKLFTKYDKNVAKTLSSFVKGCAIDVYFGLGHKTLAMTKNVCNWVAMASDAVFQDLVRQIAKVRACKKPYVSPSTVAPLLQEKFLLAQYCTKSPPRARDAMPTGTGFTLSCSKIDEQRTKISRTTDEAKAKAKALADAARAHSERAAAEEQSKKIEAGKLEEEQKRIEKEKAETAALELKAREDLEKRAAAKAQGAKAPLEKNSGPGPGTTMRQHSRVLVMDNTPNGAAAQAAYAAAEAAAASSSSEDDEDTAEESSEEGGDGDVTPV